jgi:putative acyl-CoA dehydrogenase
VYDDLLDRTLAAARDTDTIELRARRIIEDLALLTQSALLTDHAPDAVATAFSRSRIGRDHGNALGTLPFDADFDTILARSAL